MTDATLPTIEPAHADADERLIPRIIHFTIPAKPTESQLSNIETARRLHPGWEIKVFQDPLEESSFRLGRYWSKTNSGAQKADLIRLETVHQFGGFYLDSDLTVQKNLEPLRGYPFVVASEDGEVLTNAFFGGVKDSPVLGDLIDRLDAAEIDWKILPYVTTGPEFFTRELKWRQDVTVIPRETFYPFNWDEKAKSSHAWTYGAHMWDHSWRPSTGLRWSLFLFVRKMIRGGRALRRWLVERTRLTLLNLRRTLRLHRPEPYSASGVICVQTLHGPRILLLGEDASVTPELALHGTYEWREELFARRVIRRGDWVIDVGANVGAMSVHFAQSVGPFGRLFCYEPNPLPANLLKKSLLMNWFHERAVVRQRAIGADASTKRLRFLPGRVGDATMLGDREAGTFERTSQLSADEQQIEVEVSTLDAEFPVNLPIRLVKIDVEGLEQLVLRGAARLLQNQCVDILMLECIQEVHGEGWDDYMRELRQLMDWGYKPYALSRKVKLQPITFKDIMYSRRGRNIVMVSDHARRSIAELA